jgi:hypothetical protein
MIPENPVPELIIHPPPQREPAWTVWDLLLILIFAFASFMLVGALGLSIAQSVPALRASSKQELALNPMVAVPIEFAAYLLTFIFMRVLVTARSQQDFWTAVKWKMPGTMETAGYISAGVIMAIIGQIAGHLLPIPKTLPIDLYFKDASSTYLMVAFGLLVAPLMEELLFRGLLFPLAARAIGVVSGTILTAALFALVHQGQLAQAWAPLLVLFVVGLVLTSVRARTNSVAASWIVHFSYNATLFAVLFYATGGFRHMERLAE